MIVWLMYHFIVKISTVDSEVTLLPDNQEPIYDSWLSIGNTVNNGSASSK
jgi:hypothetical protein